jgi:Ring finger domain
MSYSPRQLSSSAAAALRTQAQTTTRSEQPRDAASSMSASAGGVAPIASLPIHGTSSLSHSREQRFVVDIGSGSVDNLDHNNVMLPVNTTLAAIPDESARMNTSAEPPSSDSDIDPERQARIRWIRINRRFQLVITVVALLFSLLLFSILICWVVLTSAYVVSFDKSCDVPLKAYFWLVTFQLVMDVFRSDIMRFVFRWDANSNQRIPCRVITYNMMYLLYALMVLRLGILSTYLVGDDTTCQHTAPELFNASVGFVSLSIAAWTTIVCGYLLPFCVVAALLTHNGYHPSSSIAEDEDGPTHPVFPAAYSTTGAPPGCVDRLRVLRMDDFPANYPRECCICMEDFDEHDDVVETYCGHVFHKQCCREWLRQARSCPVCRTDIPSTMGEMEPNENESARFPLGPTGRPVVGLLRILQQRSDSGELSPTHADGAARTRERNNP